MKKEYKKHIASTEQHQVWLHRTHNSNIESILKNGLNIGADLSMTATLQPYNLQDAETIYQQTHKGSNAVIVIKIPREISERHYPKSGEIKGLREEGYLADKDVTYFKSGDFYIQRQHIHGWVDFKTGEYLPNPYLGEKQKLTKKHFPEEFYGGLEKDLETKPEKELKIKKQTRNKIEKLPSPPKFIPYP